MFCVKWILQISIKEFGFFVFHDIKKINVIWTELSIKIRDSEYEKIENKKNELRSKHACLVNVNKCLWADYIKNIIEVTIEI